MSYDVCQWHVVRSKPKQEFRVELNLRAWGVPTLLPRIRELQSSRRSTQPQYRVAALFPNYLFARFDAAKQLAKVRMTRGVQCVVSFGEHATTVDDEVIDLIKCRIGADGYVRMSEPEVGDAVEILTGPLRSVVGVFERRSSARDRVLILLTAMGGCTRISVAKADIRKCGAGRHASLTTK